MKNAIVTGGAGFIGSWLIQELLNNDYDVTAVILDFEHLLPEFENKCHVIKKDLISLEESDFNFDKDYDVFFHLAWAGVAPEHKNDISAQLNNISLSIKAIEICKAIGCRLFISTGTVAEYALCDGVMDVNGRQTPNDMYGASKVAAEYFLSVRARQLGQSFIWTIIPSTFGERRHGNNIITYTILSLLKGERPKFGNLEQMWDFLYVAEVVRAMRLISEKGKPNKTYGIGSGKYRPLRSYIEEIRDIIDNKLPLGIGDVPSMSKQSFGSCVNIYDLQKDTGFEPVISFEDGIRNTINYLKECGE